MSETTNTPIQAELTQQQALSILVQAANFAQSKGAFSLDDAAIIAKAVKVFAPAQAEAAPAVNADAETPVATPN